MTIQVANAMGYVPGAKKAVEPKEVKSPKAAAEPKV